MTLLRVIATLVVAALLCPVAGHVAPAAAAECSTGLTLTLHPGLDYLDFRITPAADAPTTPVTMDLPIYPGAAPSSLPVTRPFLEYPGTEYLQTAVAEFDAPASPDAVSAWYRDQVPACGYRLVGTGTASQWNQVISSGLWFQSTSDPHRYLSVAFEPDPSGGTLIVYLAAAVVLPPRPADSYLPTDIVKAWIRYTYRGTDDGLYTLKRTINNPNKVRALVAAVNGLTDIDSGTRSCALSGEALVHLTASDGRRITVRDNQACLTVAVGHTRPLLDKQQAGVWDVATLLVLGHPAYAGGTMTQSFPS